MFRMARHPSILSILAYSAEAASAAKAGSIAVEDVVACRPDTPSPDPFIPTGF
jgi:hypothetical protein